ncbi:MULTISPECIES: carbon-nitrogen hydrolase family protein [unclassified Haematobacter]|uniref:carbon-nitrogen hydrolase family protein n=1 Tax=unclassified Haematobacter TaxID=2640585 RepID=UPI0025BE4D13|nr:MULTISPECIES: carbon-nitrogen hydrolase family protein [unclassified Haematobacter]
MKIKAAVIQIGSVPFDASATVEKVGEHVRAASAQGAELVVLPEALVSAYPKGVDFGARVGGRLPEGRDAFLRYFDSAIDVPGTHTDRLAEICREARVHMVIGVIERDGGTLYCTVLFFSPEEGLLGKHRKLMPTAMERLIWGFGDGSTLPVFETEIGRLGSVICWENYMPMLRMAMYGKGIQLYCAPTADDSDGWTASMRHIAREGRCFVFSACQYITRAAFPADYIPIQGNDPETVLMRGGSVIVNPLGEILAGPVYGKEATLIAEVDMDDIARGKYDFDVVGHYSRPDIFSLIVDEEPKFPVIGRE